MIFSWAAPIAAAPITPDYPAEADVKLGVEYADGDMTGTLTFVLLTLRDKANAILALIGASSLTDDEWAAFDAAVDEGSTSEEYYAALKSVLDSRGAVSSVMDRLKYYYWSRGVMVDEVVTAKSNILIGGGVC